MKKRKIYHLGILIFLFLMALQYKNIAAQINTVLFQPESSEIIIDINTVQLFESFTASSPQELIQKKVQALDELIDDEESKFEEEDIEEERLKKIEKLKIDVLNGLL